MLCFDVNLRFPLQFTIKILVIMWHIRSIENEENERNKKRLNTLTEKITIIEEKMDINLIEM